MQHPEDIKAELRKQGITLSMIASELEVSVSAVSRTLHKQSVSARIDAAIQKHLNKPLESRL